MPPRTRDKEATRRRITDAAIAVFAAQGYHAAGVDQIIREAGVSKGAFYHHFQSKQAVFAAVLELISEELKRVVQTAADTGRGAVSKVEMALAGALQTFARQPQLTKILLIDAPAGDPAIAAQIALAREALAALIMHQLEEASREGSARVLDPLVTAHAWVGATEAVVSHWLRSGQERPLQSALPALHALLLRTIGLPSVDSASGGQSFA